MDRVLLFTKKADLGFRKDLTIIPKDHNIYLNPPEAEADHKTE